MVAAIVWLQAFGDLMTWIIEQYSKAQNLVIKGYMYEEIVAILVGLFHSGEGRPLTSALRFCGTIPPWVSQNAYLVVLGYRGGCLVSECRDLPTSKMSTDRSFPAPWFYRSTSSQETVSFLEGRHANGEPILLPDQHHHRDIIIVLQLEDATTFILIIQCKHRKNQLDNASLMHMIESVTPTFAFLNSDSVCFLFIYYLLSLIILHS
jgi:hypothetical protein